MILFVSLHHLPPCWPLLPPPPRPLPFTLDSSPTFELVFHHCRHHPPLPWLLTPRQHHFSLKPTSPESASSIPSQFPSQLQFQFYTYGFLLGTPQAPPTEPSSELLTTSKHRAQPPLPWMLFSASLRRCPQLSTPQTTPTAANDSRARAHQFTQSPGAAVLCPRSKRTCRSEPVIDPSVLRPRASIFSAQPSLLSRMP